MGIALVMKHIMSFFVEEEQGNGVFTIHFTVKLFKQLYITNKIRNVSVLKMSMPCGFQRRLACSVLLILCLKELYATMLEFKGRRLKLVCINCYIMLVMSL